MAEEIIETVDSETTTEDQTVETGEVTLTVDDYNNVVAERDAEKAKNAKLYARLKKTETSKPLEKVSTQATSPELSQELAIMKLKVDHGIKDPQAIEFLMKNGGEKALENPFIKQTMENMLKQKATEEAQIVEETQKSDFERKVTKEQMKAMTSEELEKVLPHVQ